MKTRGIVAAVVLLAFGLALMWLGFPGRLGVMLAAVLAPTTVEPTS